MALLVSSVNLFPYYSQYLKSEKIIGIDKSFLNLYQDFSLKC